MFHSAGYGCCWLELQRSTPIPWSSEGPSYSSGFSTPNQSFIPDSRLERSLCVCAREWVRARVWAHVVEYSSSFLFTVLLYFYFFYFYFLLFIILYWYYLYFLLFLLLFNFIFFHFFYFHYFYFYFYIFTCYTSLFFTLLLLFSNFILFYRFNFTSLILF